jgi:hypothetical protein
MEVVKEGEGREERREEGGGEERVVELQAERRLEWEEIAEVCASARR